MNNKEYKQLFDKPAVKATGMPQRKNHKSMSGTEMLNKLATKDLTRDNLNRIIKK